MRHRKLRLSQTKVPTQHSDSLVENIGGAKAPSIFEFMQTDVGARTTDGSTQNIQANATTDSTCMVGQIIKYVNLFIQVSPRPSVGAEKDQTGWLEYAIVTHKESDPDIPITLLGIQTLGDTATKMYRNECIWTGFIPIGTKQANGQSLHIKIPVTKQKLKVGDRFVLYSYFRDILATSTSVDAVRLITSCVYKAYT